MADQDMSRYKPVFDKGGHVYDGGYISHGKTSNSLLSIPCPRCGYAVAGVSMFSPTWSDDRDQFSVTLGCLGCNDSHAKGTHKENLWEAAKEAIRKYIEQTS